MPGCRHGQSSYDKFRKERSRFVGFASPGNQSDHLRALLETESSQRTLSPQNYGRLLTVLSLLPMTWQMSAGLLRNASTYCAVPSPVPWSGTTYITAIICDPAFSFRA
jgi:hypothetical protein